MSSDSYSTELIAGLGCRVWGNLADREAGVIFLLHGIRSNPQSMASYGEDLAAAGFIAIALEQRNHGRRSVDRDRNLGSSPRYALDTYGIYSGTARDVSSIIDMLPATLGLDVMRIGITGVSLGGHAALFAMAHDQRIRVGVPFIGTASRLEQMQLRGDLATGKQVPKELLQTVLRLDPVYNARSFADRPLLMINGGADLVVPYQSNQTFYDKARAEYANPDLIRLSIHQGVEHTVTDAMWAEGREWFIKHL